MTDRILTTPVLFVIFNRPDTTQRVFNEIRKAKPAKLFVAADGPREKKEGEAEKCGAARSIIKQVDWDCEVKTLFRDENLGCKLGVSSAIDWVFSAVKEAIILEDDCLPHPTFFRYCQELLEKYRDDERIMVVSGDNFQFGRRRTNDSYYFSRHPYIWGWATWRRAWLHYDGDMTLWPEIRDGGWLKDIFGRLPLVEHRSHIFQAVYEGGIDSWAYPWIFACHTQNSLAILPNVNLVSHIGYGSEGGTHVKGKKTILDDVATVAMDLPLKHPPFVIRNAEADNFFEKKVSKISNIVVWKAKRALVRVLGRRISKALRWCFSHVRAFEVRIKDGGSATNID